MIIAINYKKHTTFLYICSIYLGLGFHVSPFLLMMHFIRLHYYYLPSFIYFTLAVCVSILNYCTRLPTHPHEINHVFLFFYFYTTEVDYSNNFPLWDCAISLFMEIHWIDNVLILIVYFLGKYKVLFPYQ